jgi:hypothetical protein
MRFVVLVSATLLVFLVPLRCAPHESATSTIQIGNSQIAIVQENGRLAVSHEEIRAWVRAAAESVATYYQRYPVPRVVIRVIPFEGKGVRGGQAFSAAGGGMIRVHVGSQTNFSDLEMDWIMTHEMVHLAFPSVAERHHWIEEGIATYVEPIARTKAGHMQASEMWYELARDLPQGLPEAGDEGLDNTHTWGRTYWGGALFCFLADLEIHRQTHNHMGLEDALRGILAAGGDIRQDWDLDKALTIGDRATGVAVLVPLYEQMRNKPVHVDLGNLWKQLGLEVDGKGVRFDDTAPLAATRTAITDGMTSSRSVRDGNGVRRGPIAQPRN